MGSSFTFTNLLKGEIDDGETRFAKDHQTYESNTCEAQSGNSNGYWNHRVTHDNRVGGKSHAKSTKTTRGGKESRAQGTLNSSRDC